MKLSYPVGDIRLQGLSLPGSPWKATRKYGTQGPVWWCEYRHEDDGTLVRAKGVGTDAHLLWEGSVPKFLAIDGVAPPASVRAVDEYLRSVLYELPAPRIRRVDVTSDVCDPDGAYLQAAKGWNPHERSRYREAVHLNRSNGGVTVAQMNKSRMIRVYDKYAESEFAPWAKDLTRIEYQMRGEWCEKMGLDRLHSHFELLAERAIEPLVRELGERVSRPGCSPERLLRPEGRK